MIILDSHTKSLIINSDTANLEWTTSYVNKTFGSCSNASSESENQGVTIVGNVTAIPAPTLSTPLNNYVSEIEYIGVYNPTINTATVFIKIDISGTPKIIFKVILYSGWNLIYNEDSGWQLFDATGNTPAPSPIFDDMTYIQLSGTDNYSGTIPGLIDYSQILNKNVGVIISNPNTGPATVIFNGLALLPITKFNDAPLDANDFKHIGQRMMGVYDGTNFQIVTVTDNLQDDV